MAASLCVARRKGWRSGVTVASSDMLDRSSELQPPQSLAPLPRVTAPVTSATLKVWPQRSGVGCCASSHASAEAIWRLSCRAAKHSTISPVGSFERNLERLALLEAGEPVRQVEHGEHVGQLILALSQMRPPFIVYREEPRIRKGGRGLQCVLTAHGHMEASAGLGCAGKQHDNLGRESIGNLCGALEP